MKSQTAIQAEIGLFEATVRAMQTDGQGRERAEEPPKSSEVFLLGGIVALKWVLGTDERVLP